MIRKEETGMELTFQEIRSLTHGADHFTEEKDGLHFHKCTEKQERSWREADAYYVDKTLSTTGVRLETVTDAEAITFAAPCGNKFEIWIDGMFYRQILADELRKKGEIPTVKLESGVKKMMFALPSHSTGVLASFALSGATFCKPVTYEKKILFIGDSITQGWNSKYDTLSYAYRTAMTLGMDFHICGIGGGRYIPETFDRVAFDPDTVVIAYGVNDFKSEKRIGPEIVPNIRRYLDRVKEAYGDRRVVVLTPIWFAVRDAAWNDRVRSSVANVAKEKGFEVVDGITLFPKESDFYSDGCFHPNDLGFSIYAERLIEYFRKGKQV